MAKRVIKLSKWVAENGISKLTAWHYPTAGKIPGAYKKPNGQFIVEVEEPEPETYAALYARVSSHDQKADLDQQIARLATHAANAGLKVGKVVMEIGSGLNDKRRELTKLFADPAVDTTVVEHKDRLTHFGVEHLHSALAATGRRIIIVAPGEVEDDLVHDIVDLITCLSARLYGRRSARNRAKRALEALNP